MNCCHVTERSVDSHRLMMTLMRNVDFFSREIGLSHLLTYLLRHIRFTKPWGCLTSKLHVERMPSSQMHSFQQPYHTVMRVWHRVHEVVCNAMTLMYRAAAARCRNKKKLWMNSLEQKADNITAANSALQVVNHFLQLLSDLTRRTQHVTEAIRQ